MSQTLSHDPPRALVTDGSVVIRGHGGVVPATLAEARELAEDLRRAIDVLAATERAS